MIVATLLTKEREADGMPLGKFLDESGISQSSWSRITRGKSFFTLEELSEACRVLGKDMHPIIEKAESAAEDLQDKENIEVLREKTAKNTSNVAATIIAGAALAFLISRIGK